MRGGGHHYNSGAEAKLEVLDQVTAPLSSKYLVLTLLYEVIFRPNTCAVN